MIHTALLLLHAPIESGKSITDFGGRVPSIGMKTSIKKGFVLPG
jgi:hypothetical protein